MAKEKKYKGFFGKVVDAVTGRDDKAETEPAEAAEAAETARKAKAAAAVEESRRQIADNRAKAAEEQAREATEKVKAMEAEAAEKAKQEEMRVKLEEHRARRDKESAERVAAEEAAANLVYTVKPGDSLSKIAKEKLGDAKRWPEIFELNKDQIADPNLIRVGQELRMPKK